MRKQESRSWILVASLFVTLAIVWGVGYDIIGVFFHPLHNQYGWDRTHLSLLATSLSISYGISLPLVGWMLDRVDARVVIGFGAATVGVALATASRADSLTMLLASYFLLGIGTAAASLMPASLVIANWFGERRGTALGLATAGVPVGEWTMTLVASYSIVLSGWRTAYLILALPLFLIVIPLVWFTVRTRPRSETASKTINEATSALSGLEVGEALRTRAFWMVSLQWFFYTAGTAVMIVHGVPYLEGLGYSQTMAAKVWGFALGSTVIGRPLMGVVADRIGCRTALFFNCIGAGLSALLLIGASHIVLFVLFFLFFGLLLAGPVITIPMLQAETLGLKRFGALSGLTNLGFSLGLGLGPVVAGRIFDLTGSYSIAFVTGAVSMGLAGIATLLCTKPAPSLAQATVAAAPASVASATPHPNPGK